MRYSFTSGDSPGSFDLPTEQREFNRKLRLLESVQRNARLTNQLRDAARNRVVGGNAFSQHILGLAGDYVLPRGEVQAFMQSARDLGLSPVDETVKTKGTGPHVHVQAYPAGVIPRQVYQQIGVQIREEP